MSIKSIALAALVFTATATAQAEEGKAKVDGATVDAIRSAAAQMAGAAASVRLAMETLETESAGRPVTIK